MQRSFSLPSSLTRQSGLPTDHQCRSKPLRRTKSMPNLGQTDLGELNPLPKDVLTIIIGKLPLNNMSQLNAVSRAFQAFIETSMVKTKNIPDAILKIFKNEKNKKYERYADIKDMLNIFASPENKAFLEENTYFHDLPKDKLQSLADILKNDTHNEFKDFIKNMLLEEDTPFNRKKIRTHFKAINNLITNHHEFFTENKELIPKITASLYTLNSFIDFAQCQNNLDNQTNTKRQEFFDKHFNILKTCQIDMEAPVKLQLFEIAPDFAVRTENDLQNKNPLEIGYIVNLTRATSPDFMDEKWKDLKKKCDNRMINLGLLARATSPKFMDEKWEDLKGMDIMKRDNIVILAEKQEEPSDFLKTHWGKLKNMAGDEIVKFVA